MAHSLLRRVSLVGGLLSMLVVGLPQAVSAQIVTTTAPNQQNPEAPSTVAQKAAAPVNGITLGVGGLDPSRHITVNITDAGFDKTAYTVLTSLGLNYKSDIGTVNFVNNGTMVHTATLVQGSGYLRASEDQYVACSKRSCSGDGTLDTGGISPGQSVVVAFQYLGTGQITSATDCTGGNATPGFNCTPSTLTVKATGISNILNSSMEGTILHNADGTLSTVRTFNSTQGSTKKPLSGSVTVNIDDEKGFDPTTLFILAGTDVTWVNNASNTNTHSVRPRSPACCAPDWVNLLDSGGLAPGQSYTYHFDCAPDPGCQHMGGYTNKQVSVIATDLIPASANGASTNNGTDNRFVARIAVIPLPSS